MKKLLILLLLFTVALAACTTKPSPTMEGTPISGDYPAAGGALPTQPSENGYPASAVPQEVSILLAQSGDENLTRGEVAIESTQLLTLESNPPQYKLMITGSLPTSCHQSRAEVAAPDATGKIVITLYSLSSPDQVCTQVIQPFVGTLDLGSFAKGSYAIELNGVTVTQFDAP